MGDNKAADETSRQSGNTNRKPVDWFGHYSSRTSAWLGSKWAFTGAILVIVAWAVTGPMFHYSDSWQLVIDSGTSIVTFLMVFLIQNTQNKDARAINLKLDELIRAIGRAENQMMKIEKLTDEELDALQLRFEQLRATSVEQSERNQRSEEG